MIGWRAAFLAVAVCVAPTARAAEDLNDAVRELARKTAAAVGKGDPVSLAWRNLSSLGSPAVAQARSAFETALREAGARTGENGPAAEAQVVVSENATEYLLVEEFRKGDDRQVWMAAWKRAEAGPAPPAAALSKRLLWEHDEPILDIAPAGDGWLVLTGSALLRTDRRQSVPIVSPKPWPRDLRGRLHVNGSNLQVSLPGVSCSGAAEPALTLACRPGDEPWTLDSGSHALLLADFASNRNFFDGRVVNQTGQPKTVPPFYSAAAVEEAGRLMWLLALVDGHTEMFDAALDPAGRIAVWGSDITGVEARCGGASLVLATRPGDGPDTVQAFTIVNRAPVAVGPPLEFPGPVTALWPSGVAVVHNAATGKYQAYSVTVTCGL